MSGEGGAPKGEEVEIKLRLPAAAAHARLAEALQPGHRCTHNQENYFFDGSKQVSSLRRC